jgi:hypothetical protein
MPTELFSWRAELLYIPQMGETAEGRDAKRVLN